MLGDTVCDPASFARAQKYFRTLNPSWTQALVDQVAAGACQNFMNGETGLTGGSQSSGGGSTPTVQDAIDLAAKVRADLATNGGGASGGDTALGPSNPFVATAKKIPLPLIIGGVGAVGLALILLTGKKKKSGSVAGYGSYRRSRRSRR